jgi:hypothetical protein
MKAFGLSRLELATLHLLATRGLSNAELGEFFGVRDTAIRSRVHRICRATEARTRLEIVLFVHQREELAKAAAAAFRKFIKGRTAAAGETPAVEAQRPEAKEADKISLLLSQGSRRSNSS